MDPTRDVLRLLAQGRTPDEILALHPHLTRADVAAAAARALAALETRAQRAQRLRRHHPRAYEPWTEDEDALLLRRFDEGAPMSELARALGRPPGAVRARLERWLGPSWRSRGLDAPRSP